MVVVMSNLYLENLSLEAELPRLSEQAKLLYMAQKPFLDSLEIPLNTGYFLDAGAGTGHLTNFFPQHLKGYEKYYAVDISEEMVMYGLITTKNIHWQKGSIYDLPFKNNLMDFIHVSYIFIHLNEPEKALRELKRILHPKGFIYIVNPNDRSFQGHPALLELVREHAKVYEGDRYVAEKLPSLAEEAGLSMYKKQILHVDNKGSDDGPVFNYPNTSLGRMTSWSLLSYMGQRDEVHDLYTRVQGEYMNNKVDFSAEIEIQVYTQASE